MNIEDIEMQAEYDFSNAVRGAIVPPAPNMTQVTLRLDTDVLEWFRTQVEHAEGGSYQDLINIALREYVQRNHGKPPEAPFCTGLAGKK